MKRALTELQNRPFDLLILGGGITGAGVALDATLRGFQVALIDKGDFAGGTSSVSSKLIHGGLRYLERLQWSLVQEALSERGRLLRNAPHLVQPLRFLLPYYSGARVKPWQWRAALTLYDLLAGSDNLQRSRPVPLTTLQRELPGLSSEGLTGGVQYFDAQMDDARLCLAVMRTAAREGACVANYVKAAGFQRERGRISGVRALDQLSGDGLFIRARLVLNATGPWVDEICRLVDPGVPAHLEATKGVHLVLPSQGLPAGLLLLHPGDGRVFFVLPWLGKTLVGTTDTFADSGPDDLTVSPAELDYLLQGYNRHFQRRLTESDVISTFAGLRPLLRGGSGNPSARSREFSIFDSPSGLLSVAGGKYTTYRSMAEQVTDEVQRRLGRRGWCRTRDYRLDGAPSEPWEEYFPWAARRIGAQTHLSLPAAHHLLKRYGTRAFEAVRYIREPADVIPLVEGEPDMAFELRYQRDHEMALTDNDHWMRRMRVGLLTPWRRPSVC